MQGFTKDKNATVKDSEKINKTNSSGDRPLGSTHTSANLEHISTDNPVEIYLKEMSQVPLLKHHEEIDLAKRIEKGCLAEKKLRELTGNNNSNQHKNLELLKKDGLRARRHIIKANTRLVVSIAKKYTGRGVPFLDLIQEGNLGLIKAVEKFDYHRGLRFSTYATWWIRQMVTRSIANQSRTIRLPVHVSDRIRRLYKTSYNLEQDLGRPPSSKEIAEEMNTSQKKVDWMIRVSRLPLSLDCPIGNDEDAQLGMFVEDRVNPSPSRVTFENMLRDKIRKILSTLTPREARILRLRFGLDYNRTYTLEEIGNMFDLTRERIRQIEGKALRRLRHPCRARKLREFL